MQKNLKNYAQHMMIMRALLANYMRITHSIYCVIYYTAVDKHQK